MDGITLYALRYELCKYLPFKVQKIYQIGKDRLVFHLWNKEAREKLELAFTGMIPYFGFSWLKDSNPKTPPPFVLALRKRLEGGSLVAVDQEGLDRVLYLEFDGHDDFGNIERFTLVMDMAGKGSNIGIYRDRELVVSMLVPDEVRFSHGSAYVPPTSNKIRLRGNTDPDSLAKALFSQGNNLVASILTVVDGVGKDFCQSVAFETGVKGKGSYTYEQSQKAASILLNMIKDLERGDFSPGVYRKRNGDLMFHAFPIRHLEPIKMFSDVLTAGAFYREKSILEMRFRSEKASKIALAQKALRKVESRLDAQILDLKKTKDHEELRLYAELIDASGVRVPAGRSEIMVLDYYADPPRQRAIPLDPRYSSSQNARNYYAKYRKAVRAQRVLSESIQALKSLVNKLEEILGEIESSEDIQRLIRTEPRLLSLSSKAGVRVASRLVNRDEFRARHNEGGGGISIEVLVGPSGSTIMVGGNAQKNDYLVTRVKKDGDLWFHVKGEHGAHVLLRPQPQTDVSDEDIVFAAKVAAEHSRARQSSKVEVDYVEARKVRKPKGKPPGFVTYTGQKTLVVTLNSQNDTD
jgi:predicted ribosome quality control (RQC) complex YloA/Tae2 family protein